ncbi:3970_t:CDS:1, partial [Paraglomus brasilianum]
GELKAKNVEAEEKLKIMLIDQQKAETKKEEARKLDEVLAQQKVAIEERRTVVMDDLANAEPAVEEAKKAVSGIKKQHLTEVRHMNNPPAAVKLAIMSVCTLLNFPVSTWKDCQSVVRKDDFIANIVNYDTDKNMTKSIRERMKAEYVNQKEYNYDTVNKASKACGPLVKWVTAQVGYSEILDRVGPLRNEVMGLQTRQETTEAHAEANRKMIADLEKED